MSGVPFIYRFERDLRLDDHSGLAAAAQLGPVYPVLSLDIDLMRRLRRSPRRAAFFCGAVRSLDADLRAFGSRLTICRGSSSRGLLELARTIGAGGVVWSAGEAEVDARQQSLVEEAGLQAVIVHDAPAIALEETASRHTGGGDGYRSFKPYFDVWSQAPIVSYEQPLLLRFASVTGDSGALPQPAEFDSDEPVTEAGAGPARARFDAFCREAAAEYESAIARPWMSQTSRLSADLSFGTIAARTIVREVRSRLDDPSMSPAVRTGLRLFLRSIARRDFFLQLAHFFPESRSIALRDRMRKFPFVRSGAGLARWSAGETGFPLVDAGIRQLRSTGWMHPFVRAVAASFCCFDLGVHWESGMAEWDRHLIEDDSVVAAGNWQWIAASGADMAQYPRIYNPERARRRSDPDGRYVREWIPELAHASAELLAQRAVASPQLALDLSDAGAYPEPMLDHFASARTFLRRYREYISGSGR
ncbi:MAG TPA: FAD-binding domain-containing protein [Candidatus Tumulicola sp.]